MSPSKWNNLAARKTLAILGTACGTLWLALSPAQAVDNWRSQASCTTDLCDASVISSTLNPLNLTAKSYGGEWTEKFWSAATGGCMRLQVMSAFGADLEMNVVSPSGVNFRDDDSGGSLLPRVEIASTEAGYYTAVIHSFSGSSAVNADFIMEYGNFNAGNINCANPTTPQ